MDKGFSSSRDPRTRRPPPAPQQPPKTIGNGPPRPDDLEFNDSSRDPRLNHDKYQKIMNKPRISPDTTAKMMKSESQEIPQEKCTYCPMSLNQRKIQDHVLNKHKNLLFACGLCSGSAGSIFESIQETRSHVQNIHEIAEEIVDKLIKLPTGNFLKSYKCIMCPGNSGNLIGVSEETLKMHFKEKHKTNAIKPFMLKRTCRICNYDKAPSDVELKKHFETVHPKSDYWQDDEEEQADEEQETEVKTEAPEETYSQSSSKYETSEYGQQQRTVETYKTEKNTYEDGLDYEPQDDERSQSPQNPIDSMPEEGEVSDEPSTSKKSKKRKKESVSRSSSRSSSASEKPKQYKDDSDSDNSSSEDEVKIKPKKKKKSKKSHKEKESKRKVYVKEDVDDRDDRDRDRGDRGDRDRDLDQGSAKPKSRDDSFFGVTYIPPAGFCEECDVRYENGEKAQYHFKSRNHMYNVKDKYRCYFCNSYVQDTKGHLESQHRDMTFKCLLRGCAQPRFTQANKVIDHVRCNHPQDYKKTRSDDDLFRMRMVSMPRSLSSYGCRECNVVFHGDIKIAIVHLVLEHGRNIPERHHLRFSCRVCSNKESFSDPKDLERHCQIHYEASKGSYVDPRSRSQSTGRDSRSSSRSRSRSPRGRSPRRSRSRTPDQRRWRSPPDRRSSPPGRRSPPPGGRRSPPPGRRSPPGGRRSPPPGRRSPPGGGPPQRSRYGDGGLRTEVERDRENERSDKGGRTVFTCHYCKDQFRTLSVRKNHMLREHERNLFNCGFCTFVNMYRRDLLWHLREHHRKTGYSDEMMLREMVKWPKDLRKLVCIKCTESEANENSTWLCCDPNEITKELKAHAGERHNIFDDEVESCFNLQCSGCTDKWELVGEIKDWDQHMEEVPCKNRRRSRSRSRSKSRSRSRSGSGSRRPRSPPPAPPTRRGRSSPVEVNIEHQCSYCSKEIEDKYKMDEHIRQRHLDVAFVCRLCDTGDHHYEPDLVSMKKHLKESHDKEDIDNEDPMDFVRYPKNLICIKCNMCGLHCHAQKISEVELHFNIAHEELGFSESHLQFVCRICTKEYESLDDVKDHLEEVHPEELK